MPDNQAIKKRLRRLCVYDYGEALLDLLCAVPNNASWGEISELIEKQWIDGVILAAQPQIFRALIGDDKAKQAFAQAFARRLSHEDTRAKLRRYGCWEQQNVDKSQQILNRLFNQYFSDFYAPSERDKTWRQIKAAIDYLQDNNANQQRYQHSHLLALDLLALYQQTPLPTGITVPKAFKDKKDAQKLNEKMLEYLYEFYSYHASVEKDFSAIGRFLPAEIEAITWADIEPCLEDLLPKEQQAMSAKVLECKADEAVAWSQSRLAEQAEMKDRKTWKKYFDSAQQKLRDCLKHWLDSLLSDTDALIIEPNQQD